MLEHKRKYSNAIQSLASKLSVSDISIIWYLLCEEFDLSIQWACRAFILTKEASEKGPFTPIVMIVNQKVPLNQNYLN